MARVYDSWHRLVRATLKREQLRNAGQGHGRTSSGIAGAVPPSLGKTTNIDAILQAADDIQAEDANVARICKHSFSFFSLVNSIYLRFATFFWTSRLLQVHFVYVRLLFSSNLLENRYCD